MLFIDPPEPFELLPLRLEDVPAVMEIEQEAKPSPWTVASYVAELENPQSRPRLLWHVRGLVAYTVQWLVADELQVQTLVCDEAWRGRGWGEFLLLEGMWWAMEQGAMMATLEVRESNHIAQRLYAKYGFVVMGKRPRYYRDNGEAALLMTADVLGKSFLASRWLAWQERYG